MSSFRKLSLGLVLLACPPAWNAFALADDVALKKGGVIRGEILADRKTPGGAAKLSVRLDSGATVTVLCDDVREIVRDAPAVNRPVAKKPLVKIKKTSKSGLETASSSAADSPIPKTRVGNDRAPIRNQRDQRRSPAAVLLTAPSDGASAAEKAWFKKVKQLRGWLAGDIPEKKAAALQEFRALRTPDAVPALVYFLRDDADEELRQMYVEILARTDGERTIAPLAVQSIADAAPGVRAAAMTALQQKDSLPQKDSARKDSTRAIPVYLRALKHPQNQIVNRAGQALALVGDETAVLPLIEALVTRHEYVDYVLEKNEFTCNDQQFVRGVAVLPPHIALQVAMGQLPAPPESEAVSPFIAPEVREVTVEKYEENAGVLAALSRLTDRDFGFDKSAWRKWYHAGKKVRPTHN